MDMRFLYDADRRLFAIGYQVGGPQTFSSHYDLLASEARLTSLVAIAKNDAPVEHWFALGRPYTTVTFTTPGPYRVVRHPLYFGFIVGFWMTPTMTYAHLLFAIATAAYILLAIQFEERDLVREHGPAYEEYRRRTPMLIPGLPRRA